MDWQLYTEPKPKFEVEFDEIDRHHYSALKENDWVEVINNKTNECSHQRVVSANFGILTEHGLTFRYDGTSHNHFSLLRRLRSHEVVVAIGYLSGTVRRLNDLYFAMNPSKEVGWVVPEATIPFAMLDEPMQSTVRALLDRQEKERGKVESLNASTKGII